MPKTLDEGFKTFLGWLAPLESEHNKANSHRNSVKRSLENNFACYQFFETGSFGNSTGVRHHSDTDYFAACPVKNLSKNSSIALRQVKESLQYTFHKTTGIEVRSPAVRIPFGQYSSEDLEITPCIFNGLVETPVGKMGSYSIPDFNGGWMNSSPSAHNAYVKRENERLKGKLKPLIQLVKAWKFYNNVPIISFHIELRVTKFLENQEAIVYDQHIYEVINHLLNKNLASIRDPMGISGLVPACKTELKRENAISKLKTALTRAEKAYSYRKSNLDKGFHYWNLFYNKEFPAR